jgi:hypothetical protein
LFEDSEQLRGFLSEPENITTTVPDGSPQAKAIRNLSDPSGRSGKMPPDDPGGTLSTLDDTFGELSRVLLPEEIGSREALVKGIMRLHEGHVTDAVNALASNVSLGNRMLREAGLTISHRGQDVIKESAIPKMEALYRKLHDPNVPIPGDTARERQLFQDMYNELRRQTDLEETLRVDFDPRMAMVNDYFYRGWKMGRELARISAMQGIKYRQQSSLIDTLKRLEIAKPSQGEVVLDPDWRVPKVGPAFEGKIVAIGTKEGGPEAGEPLFAMTGQWVVSKDVANRLENIYGVMPDPGSIRVAGKDIEMSKVIDALVFIPKRAKLFGSLFQQVDFVTRNNLGTWGHVTSMLRDGKGIEAVEAIISMPEEAANIVRANFSPDRRELLKAEFLV